MLNSQILKKQSAIPRQATAEILRYLHADTNGISETYYPFYFPFMERIKP